MSSSPSPQWTVLPPPIVDSQPVNNLFNSSFSDPNTEIDELANDEDLFPHASPQNNQAKSMRQRQSTKRKVKMGVKTSLLFDYKQPVTSISADKSKPSNLQVEDISPDSESTPVVLKAKPNVQGLHSTRSTSLKFTSHSDFRRSNLFWMSSKPITCQQILNNLLKHRAGTSPVTSVTNPPTVSKYLEQKDVSIVDTIPALSSPKPSFYEDNMVVDLAESAETEKSEGEEGEAVGVAMEVDIPPLPNLNSTASSILGALAAVSIKEHTAFEELPQPPSKLPISIKPTTPIIQTARAAATASNSPNASIPPALPVPESLSIPISPPPSIPITSPITPTSPYASISTADIRNEAHAAKLFVPPSRKRPLQDSYRPNNAGDRPSSPKRMKCSVGGMTPPMSWKSSTTKPRSSTGENSVECHSAGFGEQLAVGWKKSILELEEALVNVSENQGKLGLSDAVKRYHYALENARSAIGIIDDGKKLISIWVIQSSGICKAMKRFSERTTCQEQSSVHSLRERAKNIVELWETRFAEEKYR
ncbi:hypothetical protein QCA50_000238 [Cerrena zonata]|uniref:Uncharacterized protein n=1 Tax=Cerrena zonata TaxID=2478898 RepID=A0AAW0GSI6_9APHY